MPFEQIVADFRRACPDQPCRLAFLELMSPSLPQVIDELAALGAGSITVVPLFLAPGGHSRTDLPALLDAARLRWPAVTFTANPTLTESPFMRAAIVDWARASLAGPDPA